MRHGDKINNLGRTAAHRKSMLANMACSLIQHKRINTTLAKSKEDTTHNRRIVFSRLHNKYAVTELFKNISVKIANRPGGYTRIIKLGNRLGDNAEMALIELVDYNEAGYSPKGTAKKKSTRRSRGGKKAAAEQAAPEAKEGNSSEA